jgi:hypothetical protein
MSPPNARLYDPGMTPERARLMDRYRVGAAELRAALAGVSDEDLDRPAADGGWTARHVAHHVAESEATAFIRLRRLVAEDEPAIVGYDEELYARRNHYDRPIASALAVVDAVRASSLELLESLSPEEWQRSGRHSESGSYSVDDWLRIYASHPYDHAEQVRAALGR